LNTRRQKIENEWTWIKKGGINIRMSAIMAR
jgi:hypothetical protein